MFRDLKEYQDIAKIYADKVSKPENLEERRGTDLSQDQIQKNREGLKNRIMYGNPEGKKPVSTSQSNRKKLQLQRQKQNKGRVEKQFGFLKTKPSSEFQGRKSRSSQNMQGKTKPEPEYKPKKDVVFGQRTNEVGAQGGGKPSSGDLSMFKDKKTETETKPQSKFIRDPKTKTLKRRGSPTAQRAENKERARLKAQALAKARIAAKKEGTASPQLSGKERAQQMAKDRLAKKAAMEEYTPYDIVLEYLLSSEQVATIEEANYVMTEMDAETIQAIIEEQKNLIENPLAVAGALGTAIGGGILINQMLKNKKKMEKGGEFKKGSTMDNIQKKNQMYKDFGIAK